MAIFLIDCLLFFSLTVVGDVMRKKKPPQMHFIAKLISAVNYPAVPSLLCRERWQRLRRCYRTFLEQTEFVSIYQLVPINYDKELTCNKTLRFIKSVNIKMANSFHELSTGSVSLQVDDLS